MQGRRTARRSRARRDAGLLGHLGWRVATKGRRPVVAIDSLVVAFCDNVVGQPQGQKPLRAGIGGNPLVSSGAGERHPGLDSHEPPPDIGPALTAVPKAQTVMHGRNPAAEVVGSKGQ